MDEQGMLTDDEYATAVETPVSPVITPSTSGCANTQPASAAYFCDYVRAEVLNDPAFGETADERAALLNRGGLQIITTLDLDVQEAAAATLQAQVPGSVGFADLGGSLVSTEARTGRIVAMAQNTAYGSSQEGDGVTQVNYAADASHGGSTGFQVGSTYKAFTLVDWLENGNSLYDRVQASKNAWNTSEFSSCQGGFGASSYDVTNDTGGRASDMTPLQATTRSVNTAFIAMASQLDLCDIAGAAGDLGVTNADGRELSIFPSDILGSGANAIAPLQMASAFGSIANGGTACSPIAIDSVTRPDGSTVTPPSADCRQAIDPAVASTTAFALESVLAPGGTGTASNPGDGIDLLGKTGTTDNAKDTWMVGSTTEVATAVWVGNVQGEVSMRQNALPGGGADTARHRVFQPYMQAVNALYGGQPFAAPSAELTERPAPRPPRRPPRLRTPPRPARRVLGTATVTSRVPGTRGPTSRTPPDGSRTATRAAEAVETTGRAATRATPTRDDAHRGRSADGGPGLASRPPRDDLQRATPPAGAATRPARQLEPARTAGDAPPRRRGTDRARPAGGHARPVRRHRGGPRAAMDLDRQRSRSAPRRRAGRAARRHDATGRRLVSGLVVVGPPRRAGITGTGRPVPPGRRAGGARRPHDRRTVPRARGAHRPALGAGASRLRPPTACGRRRPRRPRRRAGRLQRP
nr:hypothetical protein GCM10025699_42030 [Microbacterium flavescens]